MATKCCEKPLQEVIVDLKELSESHDGGTLSQELQKIVYELKSSRLRHSSSAHSFCINGGLQPLLSLLSQCACASQDAVLLMGLLGNLCSLDNICRDTVMTESNAIVDIVKTNSHPDVLNTSARLLANLALDHTHIPTLQSAGAVHALTHILTRGNITDSCKRSVLRALRIFGSNSECREEIKTLEGVQAIVECLQSHDSHVTISAVQALQVMTQEGDFESIHPLCNKTTMQLVVRFCNHSKASVRESSMKVLLNSAKTTDGRVTLSSAGGVETLVGFIETYLDQPSVLREVVCAVCLCCRDVISRQRLRDCGGLQRLITMLADDKYMCVHVNILSALVCYYFDETTLKAMVASMGLLKALVFHLKAMITQTQGEVVGVTEETLAADDISPLESENESDWTTEPGPSITSQSPILPSDSEATPGNQSTSYELPPMALEDLPSVTPPPTKRPRLELDLDSVTPMPSNFIDSLLSSPSPYKVDRKPPDSPFSIEPGPTLDSQIILLLSRVSHLRDCLSVLSTPEILSNIFDYFLFMVIPNAHVFKVLTRVFINAHCFQDVLLTLVPSKLFKQLQHSSEDDSSAETQVTSPQSPTLRVMCVELLDRLSKVAESPYGQGVLAHMLLRGETKEKQASCLSLPVLCKSTRVCKKMMLSYGGYQELSSMATIDGDTQTFALDSLLALAVTTAHTNTHLLSDNRSDQSNSCRYMDSDHTPFDLTLVVYGPEGGMANIQVHKQVLVESSDVFRVMLEGGYREARCSHVTLRDVLPMAFVSLIHYLYGCGWQCKHVYTHPISESVAMETTGLSSLATMNVVKSITCHIPTSSDHVTHCLMVLVTARRFLLSDLATECQHAAVQFVAPSNIVEMFYFATMHECYCLSESCIRVVMAMDHSELRTDVFKDLVMSCVGETVLGMLRLFLTMA